MLQLEVGRRAFLKAILRQWHVFFKRRVSFVGIGGWFLGVLIDPVSLPGGRRIDPL